MSADAYKSFEVRALEVYDALVACRLERDVALAENQRLQDVQRDLDLAHADEVNALRAEVAGASRALEDAEAENQRLRDALERTKGQVVRLGLTRGVTLDLIIGDIDEALAGDAE